jgi:uncharacterized protein YjbI with pentapeptide repeats
VRQAALAIAEELWHVSSQLVIRTNLRYNQAWQATRVGSGQTLQVAEVTHPATTCSLNNWEAPVKAQELIRQYQSGERDFVLISLRRCELSGSDLHGINLSGSELRGCDFSQAKLAGVRLRRADLSWANLSGADLSGADLGSADLRAADLRQANLSYANLEHAKVTPEQLTEAATLEGAIMPDGETHEPS